MESYNIIGLMSGTSADGLDVVLCKFEGSDYNWKYTPIKAKTYEYDAETKAKAFLDEKAERCIVKSKSAQKGAVELNMEIRLKDDNTDFVNALADMEGLQSAVLVSYNGDYMG